MGVLLGLLSWGLGFLMHWGIALAITVALAPTPAPSPAPTPTPAAQAPAPPAPAIAVPAPPANPADQSIERRLAMKAMVRDAREYNERSVMPQHARYVELFYSAGATGVWFDLEGSARLRPTRMYIRLPANPAARAACFSLYTATCSSLQTAPDPASATDQQQRYLMLPLPK